MRESNSLASSSPRKPWAETRKGRIVVIAGIFGLFLLVFWMAMQSRRMLAAPAGLVVDEQYLSLGEVWEDPAFVWYLPVTNNWGKDVEINNFRTTCTCIDIHPKNLYIPAKQKCEVRLTLDLSRGLIGEPGSSVRDFEAKIAPEISAGNQGESRNVSWTIRGRIRSAIRCDPSFVDFGSHSVIEQSVPPRRIRIKSYQPLQNLSARCSSRFFDVEVKNRSSESTNLFDLIIAPQRISEIGKNSGYITLAPELPDGRKLPPKLIPIQYQAVRDIEASPYSVSFGACSFGMTMKESVAFRSLTGKIFAITAIRCEGVGLSIERDRTLESVGSVFTVKQKIDALGEQQGKVVLQVRRLNQSEDEIVVPVSYYGILDAD